METEILKVDPRCPDTTMIERVGTVLRSGELVAFPTETVYGVGADAFNPEAATKLFEAKGRPSNNPLPVLISEIDDICRLASGVTVVAMRLIEAFFPGPLTLVFRASERVPDVVTAGTGNVGIRMPNHAVALGIISAAGHPLATSSANVSGQPAPTTADDVMSYLGGRIRMLVDGGPTSIGVASTVLDITGQMPRVLRAGTITEEMIEACLSD